MDTDAYLRKQGWKGTGHSLGVNSNGLKRPLLISKKVDVLGLGIKKHDVSDQWWMRAFDKSLQDFGTGKVGMLAQVKEHGIKRGGLYGRFVRGEGVPGTFDHVGGSGALGETVQVEGSVVEQRTKAKRKADGDGQGDAKKAKKNAATDVGSDAIDSAAEKRCRDVDLDTKRARKLNISLETYRSLPTSSHETKKRMMKSLSKLDDDKRTRYAQRAAAKGMPLEVYYVHRILKNEEAAGLAVP